MQLKTEQMIELLITLGSPVQLAPPRPWKGAERRCEPRVGIGYPTHVRALAGNTGYTGDPEPALLRDLSSRGVGIMFHRPMEVGQSFVVELPRLGDGTFDVLCLVANCVPMKDGQFHIGGRFLAPWREDERDVSQPQPKPMTNAA